MKNKSYQHFLVLIACCGLAAASIGVCVNSVGVFYTTVSKDLGVLRGTFALHATFSQLATAVIALTTPTMIRRYNHKLVFTIGCLLAAISTFCMSFASNMITFYILGIIRGIGCGLFSAVGITMVINQWFDQMHGLATSIVLSFSGLAGAVCSPLLTNLIVTQGWHKAYQIMGIMIFVLCVPMMVIPFTYRPQKMNLLPYGYVEKTKEEVKMNYSNFNRKNLAYFALLLMGFLHPMISGLAQHLPSYAQTIGYSATVGAFLLSIVMIGNIVFKLVIGALSDQLGVVKACVVMIILNAVALALFIVANSSTLLYIASFIYGSVYSVGAVGLALLTKHFFGKENYSKAFPLVSSFTSVGAALSLTVIGYVYDFFHSYLYAFMAGIGIHMIDLFLIMFIVTYLAKKKRIV